jgi:bifunctional DNA-binding transcriptional regulator/antitoxin component of YhaV-PrlF toxin-antitoxin module
MKWDHPTMIVTLDSKRRLTVPVSVAPASPGDAFEVTFDADEDAFVFRRVATKGDWLSVMKECPVPMDDLPPRRREFPRRREP